MAAVPAAPAPFRLARGCAVAVVGVSLAVAAHGLAASGSPVPAVSPLLALMVGLVVAGTVAASSRRWTPLRLVAALGAMQLAVHGALWLDSGSGVVDPRLAGLAVGHATHVHGGSVASPWMLAAHLAAVVVAALLLARIDDAVALLVGLARLLVVRWHPVVVAAPSLVPAAGHLLHAVAEPVARGPILRRGPPFASALG
jgi:hypothetical protein